MKRKILSILLAGIICLFGAKNVTFADEPDENEDEVRTIVAYIASDSVDKEFVGLNNFQPEHVMTGKIKRVNSLKNNMVTQYREGGSIASCYSDLWQYLVPIQNGNTLCVITLIENGNEVEYVGSLDGPADSVGMGKYLVSQEDINGILQNAGISRQSIIREDFLMCYMYRTLFYFFETSEGEFLIPFSDLRDTNGTPALSNGSIYAAKDLVDMLEMFGIECIDEEETYYFGEPVLKRNSENAFGGAQEKASKKTRILLVSGGILALLLFGYVSAVKINKKFKHA